MDKTEQQNKDEQFMRRALVEAEAARDEGEIPVGAVVVAATASLRERTTSRRRSATLRRTPKCRR